MVYDISNDKQRTKLFNLLKEYGTPVQKSAFEARLTLRERQTLAKRVKNIIDIETDTFIMYRRRAREKYCCGGYFFSGDSCGEIFCGMIFDFLVK
jgi:CRISPR-associated endonuclease Cas2